MSPWLLRHYIRLYEYDLWFTDEYGNSYASREEQLDALVKHIENYGYSLGFDFGYDCMKDY